VWTRQSIYQDSLPGVDSYKSKGKSKAIPVTGHGGPYGCETSMLPHFLDSRFTDGGEVVSLTHRSPFTPRNISATHFRQTVV
jgi:hypothetical protein